MTGPVTFDEASGMPWPDVLNRYQALSDRDAMAREELAAVVAGLEVIAAHVIVREA